MAGTTDDDEAFATRTRRLELSMTEVGATIRASTAPATIPDVDVSDLPRITVDTRGTLPMPPDGVQQRPDLALVATIGEGGMGRVHLARQRSLARDVAVKTLKPGATAAVASALLREARVTGLLEHPGVIPVHALGIDAEGKPLLVMKRVDGTDLSSRLAGRPQTGDRLVTILEALMQVCRTCEFAHSRGILHRDIKPENIMVGGFGEVYLLDWGIATTLGSADDAIVGTLCYMGPEMVLGRTMDARTDVYLIGATLHEVLTGRPRHGGRSMEEVARNAMFSEPFEYEPDVPEELARLCNRATAREPERRPESAAALREEIALFLRHRAARAIADAARERLASLEALLAPSTTLARGDVARAYRLVAEARFGLAQSLEQDSTSADTREALQRSALAAIELELRQGHIDTADALYKELEEPAPALEARILEGRAREEAKAKERERLERFDQDMDPTHHAVRRTRPMVFLAVTLSLIGGYLSLYREVTPMSTLGVAAFCLALIVLGVAVMWRRVMTNAFNQRGAALLVISMVFILVDRVLGVLDNRPIAETFKNDLLLLALFMAGASVTLIRSMWPGVVVLLAGLVGVQVRPDWAPWFFTVAACTNLLISARALARARRD
jgi:eukaryotic-like serine/threonine-protein kinase